MRCTWDAGRCMRDRREGDGRAWRKSMCSWRRRTDQKKRARGTDIRISKKPAKASTSEPTLNQMYPKMNIIEKPASAMSW